jgi:phosphatidylglycerophosphate synthase
MLATASRIPVGILLLASILTRSIWTIALLVTFVSWDVFDGFVARKAGQESAQRRVLDGSIDRFFACSCLLAGSLVHQRALIPVALIVAREIILACRNLRLFRRNTVLSGVGIHKATSLAQAALGATIVIGSTSISSFAAWLAFVICVATLPSYWRAQEHASRLADTTFVSDSLHLYWTTGFSGSIRRDSMEAVTPPIAQRQREVA